MNKHQSKHQFPWNTCWLAFVSVACARKEYIKGNISSFYARVPEASAAGAKSWDGDHQCLTLLSDDIRCLWKSHHIGQMSHQMSRHMYVAACQDILSYPVVVHDMGLCDVDIYVISGFQGILDLLHTFGCVRQDGLLRQNIHARHLYKLRLRSTKFCRRTC